MASPFQNLLAAYLMANPQMARGGPSLEGAVPPPPSQGPIPNFSPQTPAVSPEGLVNQNPPSLASQIPPPPAAPPPVTSASFGHQSAMPRTFAPPPAIGGALNDQNRTSAFDPVKDAMDPGNMHVVDANGMVNPQMGPPQGADALKQQLLIQKLLGGGGSAAP